MDHKEKHHQEHEKERERRKKEQQSGQQQNQRPSENRLVPDVAELKLLRRLELETIDGLDRDDPRRVPCRLRAHLDAPDPSDNTTKNRRERNRK